MYNIKRDSNNTYEIITVSAPTTMMSDGLRNILTSMVKNNVKIVSVCLSSNYIIFTNICCHQYVSAVLIFSVSILRQA